MEGRMGNEKNRQNYAKETRKAAMNISKPILGKLLIINLMVTTGKKQSHTPL